VGIIYFKCSCEKVLAVDETGVGRTVNCTDCGQPVVVPSPEIRWNCQTCGHEMAAPGELEGQKIQCTECLNRVTVPVIMRARKHRDSPKCPDCGAGIKPDAVICVNCGLNFKTGEKLKSVDLSEPKKAVLKPILIVAAIFVVCGYSLRGAMPFVWARNSVSLAGFAISAFNLLG